jgi:hypothetical protein
MATEKRFTDETWEEIVTVISSAFSLSEGKKAKLRDNPTAKLIAAIPYLAACREPERTALAHLATYLVAGSEAGKAAFDHKASDNYDLLARLATGGAFEGGDPAILNKGMKILARLLVQGYKRDVSLDKERGLYNPVGDGSWAPDRLSSDLAEAIASVEDSEMDELAKAIEVKGGWWEI